MKRLHFILDVFIIPVVVFIGIVLYLLFTFFHLDLPALLIILCAIVLGSYGLVLETGKSLLKKQFALDYIAILAIIVSLLTQEYLVAAIISLMIASGRTLEEYGVRSAKRSLTRLIDRIPSDVLLFENGKPTHTEKIGNIIVGQTILIRKGEVIPLDGSLQSNAGLTDESSLTGEPYIIEKLKGDLLRSGTINIGDPVILKVSRTEKNSTYTKIIEMVKRAQIEKAPLVRLADKYSAIFTIITFIIAAFAYLYSQGNLQEVLAVLVIATPCPLLLAAPIALLGGVNAASKKRIIVKKLGSLEMLSRATAIIFDKTGTITLGKPVVSQFENSTNIKDNDLLAISASIERNSLHPLAKAIIDFAKTRQAPQLHARAVSEIIGKGIQGEVDGTAYMLSKLPSEGMAIGLFHGKKLLATFGFTDEIKKDSREIIRALKKRGLQLFLFTGDKKAAAEKITESLGTDIIVRAECTPEDKKHGIEKLKKEGKITAMVGDGINDAPALAFADVGIVFSSQEQTAATDAADIVFLGGDFSLLNDCLHISQKTIHIATQSMLFGIGTSIVGMILASLGLIPPLFGAGLQEAIDVAVILNALRASQ